MRWWEWLAIGVAIVPWLVTVFIIFVPTRSSRRDLGMRAEQDVCRACGTPLDAHDDAEREACTRYIEEVLDD